VIASTQTQKRLNDKLIELPTVDVNRAAVRSSVVAYTSP